MQEPQDLSGYGFAPGYYIYRDGRIWSERMKGDPGFKNLDRTGCTLLMNDKGKYVRKSAKVLAFIVYVIPQLVASGYVPIFNGTAYINKNGDAYSVNRAEKLIPNLVHKYLYIHVGGKDRLLHRVVAQTFIPNPDNLPEVDHISGNKEDCSVKNLRWITRSGNMKAAYQNGALNESLAKAQAARKYHQKISEQ